MKAIAVCPNTATGVANGRVSKNRDGENAEIQMYLSKLKDLVPYMPKNRKISKLEVIQYVIDYICDLQTALDTHPAVNSFDAAAAIAGENMLAEQAELISTPHSPRQPLGVRPSPNTIVTSSSSVNNNNTNSHSSNSESIVVTSTITSSSPTSQSVR